MPNFFIEKFRIPPFLLPIYQAAGIEYGVRWEVLAAINEIETDYGRNLNVSSAGALGWMQFMPGTWELYGVDGNQDGLKDPYSPVDAIFAAARYLRAAGADKDLRAAIFAYNHADWYVDSVILRARYIGGLPADLVGSLSGLTQGRFPVQAKAAYAKEVKRKDVKAAEQGKNPAYVVESSSQRKGIKIFARSGAPVVAVNDGRIVQVGHSRRLGRFVVLQDVYGNTYTYAHLKDVVEKFPTPKPRTLDKDQVARELSLPTRDAAPARRRVRDDRGGGEGSARPRRRTPPPKPRRAETARCPRQGAPVRQPGPSQRGGGRRRAAELRALRELRQLPEPRVRARPQRRRHEAAQARRARHVRDRAGPRRAHVARHRLARAVRDPARRPRRPADRPEADPRRLEAARVDRDLPRGRPQPVRRQGRARRRRSARSC